MSNSAENSKMQANNADADAAGGAALLLPPPVPAAPVAAAEAMTATASHSARQSHCDGSYICDCRLWYVSILLFFSVFAYNVIVSSENTN